MWIMLLGSYIKWVWGGGGREGAVFKEPGNSNKGTSNSEALLEDIIIGLFPCKHSPYHSLC